MIPTVFATTPRIGHLFGKGAYRGRIFVGKTKNPTTGKEVYQTVSQKEWETHPKNPAAQKAAKTARRQASTNETKVANANKDLRAQGQKPTLADAVKEAERKAAEQKAKQKAGVSTQNQAKPQPLKGETPGNSRTNANPKHLQPNSIRKDRPLTQEQVRDLRRQTQGPTLKGTKPEPRPTSRTAPAKPTGSVAAGKGVVKPPQPAGVHSQIIRQIPPSAAKPAANPASAAAVRTPGQWATAALTGPRARAIGAGLGAVQALQNNDPKGVLVVGGTYAAGRALGLVPHPAAKLAGKALEFAAPFSNDIVNSFSGGAKPAAKPKPTPEAKRDPEFRTTGDWVGDPNAGRPKPAAPKPSTQRSPASAAPIHAAPAQVRPTVGRPTVRGTSTAAPTAPALAGRQWQDFNPGRGTSETNNPLITKDPWLLGKIKEREGKATQNDTQAPAAAKPQPVAAKPQPVAAQPLKNEASLLEQLRKKKQLRGAGYDLYSTIG